MTALVWSSLNARYETGIDRGVLYPDGGDGVVWNGLISVEETAVGGATTPLYYDGIKYMDVAVGREYQAALTTFGAPQEFGPCVGNLSMVPGFIITRQPKVRFGMSYRVMIGDNLGYKLHLVYNATATPGSKSRTTLSQEGTADQRSWTIDAVPSVVLGHRPTAHFVIDSTKTDPDLMAAIEAYLYGTTDTAPVLPPIGDIYDLLSYWSPFGIDPDTVGGMADLVPGGDDITGTETEGIYVPLATTGLTETETDGLYSLE